MKLLFRQRFFSWFDSYDIYGEDGSVVYTVEGRLAWGHCLHIMDDRGRHIATVQQKVLTLLPKFEFYLNDAYAGALEKEFTLFHPRYDLDCNGWHVDGSFMEWDYEILDAQDRTAAVISKELLHMTDTYVIEVADPADALLALMVALAIDAEKCSRNNA